MHDWNYNTPQLKLHCITSTTTALHHTTSSSCGWGGHCNHCNHSKKHNSNHLSVHQWIHSAIRESQQPTSPKKVSYSETSASALRGTTGNYHHSPLLITSVNPNISPICSNQIASWKTEHYIPKAGVTGQFSSLEAACNARLLTLGVCSGVIGGILVGWDIINRMLLIGDIFGWGYYELGVLSYGYILVSD